MKKIELFFFRVVSMLAVVFLGLAAAVPGSAATESFQSDDFNRCSVDTSVWTPGGATAVSTSGAYSGDSFAVLTVPAGQDLTFSGKNGLAPRLMQTATDTSFEVEVKFNTPLGQVPADTFNIQGILVRDTTSTPGKTKWLRFDLDANSTSINYYIGYFDENGSLHGIISPTSIGTQVDASPLYLRVKYDQPTGTWSLGYALTNLATFNYQYQFQEATAPNITGGFTFNVSDIGVFAGSTSPGGTGTPPGIVSNVDYFKSITNTTFSDDSITLAVQKVGAGNVTQQCTGNSVDLAANPVPGTTFVGWTGDVTSSQPAISLTMTHSYNVTATFTGQPIALPFKMYLPTILR